MRTFLTASKTTAMFVCSLFLPQACADGDAPPEVDAAGPEADAAPPPAEARLTAQAAPLPPQGTFSINLVNDVDQWCKANGQGISNALGGANNPCASMCTTVWPYRVSLGGAIASIASDLRGIQKGSESDLCLAAMGFDAMTISLLLNESWCGENPIQCAYSTLANLACMGQECFTSLAHGPALAQVLAGVCDFGPILASHIEMVGYRNACTAHIQNEISMPIDHQVGCLCTRQEREGGVFGVGNCGPAQAWGQIGTAAANCTDHDSAWLPVASQACLGAGASNGWTYYRYSNCRYINSTDPQWGELTGALCRTAIGDPPANPPPNADPTGCYKCKVATAESPAQWSWEAPCSQ
jgi:hypothetical protein